MVTMQHRVLQYYKFQDYRFYVNVNNPSSTINNFIDDFMI